MSKFTIFAPSIMLLPILLAACPTPEYVPLNVTMLPAEVVAAGAQWTPWQPDRQNPWYTTSGKDTDIMIGKYTLIFLDVHGWVAPASIPITVKAEPKPDPITVTYVKGGYIRITLAPDAIVNQNTQWTVDNGFRFNSGQSSNCLLPGPHTVSFSSVEGYATPAPIQITVVADQTIESTVTYPAVTGALTISSFTLANGAETTLTREVLLNHTVNRTPTHYMASESETFQGADWIPYPSETPHFILSSGSGIKTVYFKVHDAAVESASVKDSIELEDEQAGPYTLLLPGNIPMEFQWVDPGSFYMGGSFGTQQHQVTFTKGFWLGKTEVTQEQWNALMADNPSSTVDLQLPVDTVSWDDAMAYAEQINKREQGNYRLPTEAQWEYACRAGTTSKYYWGNTASTAKDYCWDYDTSSEHIHQPGLLTANTWGFFDMAGNVFEWVYDSYTGLSTDSVIDPVGPTTGIQFHYCRGGNYTSPIDDCTSAIRFPMDLNFEGEGYGFRLARLPQ